MFGTNKNTQKQREGGRGTQWHGFKDGFFWWENKM